MELYYQYEGRICIEEGEDVSGVKRRERRYTNSFLNN